jgi:hypothetical protein
MSRIGGEKMSDEPDKVIPVVLRHWCCAVKIETRLTKIEKRLDDDRKIVRYSPGQPSATQSRQAPQESRIDGLFERPEKLLSDKMPV